MNEKPYGKLSASHREGGTGGMYLRDARGGATLKGESGCALELELSTNFGSGAPIIHCKESGRAVIFGWDELIDLAIARGLLGIHCCTCAAVADISPEGEPAEGWRWLDYDLGWMCPTCIGAAVRGSITLVEAQETAAIG